MSTIGMTTAVGFRPHRVTVQNAGTLVPDGDGGFVEGWGDAVPPQISVSIQPASARDLERVAAGTVVANATHIVHAPYHPQLTVKSRLIFNARTFNVLGVANIEERNAEQILICAELLP